MSGSDYDWKLELGMRSLQARGPSHVLAEENALFQLHGRPHGGVGGRSLELEGVSCRPSSVSHHPCDLGQLTQRLRASHERLHAFHLERFYVIKCVLNSVSFFPCSLCRQEAELC